MEQPVGVRAAAGGDTAQVLRGRFSGSTMDARGSTALEAELDGFAGSAGLASLGDAIRAALPARVGSASDSMIDLSGMRAEFTSGRDRTDTIRMLTIMQEAVDRHLAVGGHLAPRTFRFTSPSPRSAAHGAYWRSVLATVQAGMASGAMDEPILARSFTDLLVRSALVCFPHSWEEGAAGPSLFAPAALRRAKAFIDAHAPEPITLVDIAEAARISPRHLQNEFRRHYGMTPTGYLRQARLTLAREALLCSAGGPGDSVASIARAAGFAHPSRFAAAYRIAFGEYPRDTLRR